jgi:flagellar basal body-associated protein FliL
MTTLVVLLVALVAVIVLYHVWMGRRERKGKNGKGT